MQNQLIDSARQMNVQVDGHQADKLIEYLQLIIKWNKAYNLSAIRDLNQGLKKHLLDSLSILPYIGNQKLLDVGSGAGLPGIVLTIMKPNLSVSVLDSVGKKCHFMQFVKTHLKLNNLNVVNDKVEHYQPDFCFGQITSRAFSKTTKTLKLSQHLLCDNGRYLLMKGANFEQETLPINAKIHHLSVPGVSDSRFLIEITEE